MSTAEEVEVSNTTRRINTRVLTSPQYHMAEDRSCRIRRGVGNPESVPNRSGWVTLGRGLGEIKKKFLKKYPAYVKTIYPTKGDNNASLWRSDPNNPDNEAAWNIPWPPFRGQPPFPEDEESPGRDEAEGAGRSRKRHKGSKRPHDPAYKNATDEDDDLESDVNNTSEVQEPNPKPGESSKAKGKRRAKGPKMPHDPAYRASIDEDDDDDLESQEPNLNPGESSSAKAKGKRRARGPFDPLYKYRRDVDVDDGLKPDFDDTDEIREMSANLEESDNQELGKGKRKLAEATATATATPSASGQGEQTPEDPQVRPAPKKVKASATPEGEYPTNTYIQDANRVDSSCEEDTG